ncbi:MAG: S8 family serine peptidase, partial [Verrucomicrobiales bacterium]|nr:S8 family serine peptidase [Verrucomicrobiales bacterium]
MPETTSEQSFEDISAQAAPVDARAALEKYRSDVPSKPRLSDEEVSRKKAEVKERQVARREAQEAPLEPGRHWRVSSGGPPIVYELAFDELWVQPVGEDGAIKSIQSTENLAELENAAQNEVGGRAQLVMYPRGEERTLYNRRIVGSQLLLSGGDEEARSTALQSLKLEADPNAKVGGPFLVVRSENRPAGVLLAMQEATDVTLPEGVTISPMLARQVQKKWIPTDPLFSGQWHLRNTGQKSGKVGEDAKTTTTWDTYRGTGVKIAIVDDGLDLTHPDLAANVAATGHYDWNGGDTNPQPNPAKEDYHGTAVGGVAAAVGGNGIGGVGTAPSATLVGYRFISGPTYDYDEYDAMTRDSGTIPIKNNSWGNPDGYGLGYVSSLFKLGVQNATETGRGGLGTIFVFAGGNGKEYDDNSNKDGYANDIHVLAVGATTNKGYGASYSEDGANLVVSAPSSGGSLDVTTTDLQGFSGYNDGATVGELSNSDYTNEFGGTSSAAPVISGVVAMMLEANPNLGWRDVKEILLRSSRKLYPTSRDWVSRSGGRVGIAPIKHQHAFGGGAVDANAATKMAMTWTNLDP